MTSSPVAFIVPKQPIRMSIFILGIHEYDSWMRRLPVNPCPGGPYDSFASGNRSCGGPAGGIHDFLIIGRSWAKGVRDASLIKFETHFCLARTGMLKLEKSIGTTHPLI